MDRHTRLLFILFFCLVAPWLWAVDFQFGASASADSTTPEPVFLTLTAGVEHAAGEFDFSWLLSGDTAGLYPAPFHGEFFEPFAVDIAEAGMAYLGSPCFFSAGKLPIYDVIDSPYSLFVNGSGLAVPGIAFGYEDERFLYRQRWTYLGADSAYGWLDRGAVQKTYGLKLGGLRFGFQDVAVTANSVMDPLDMLLPAPSFLVQYLYLARSRPWTKMVTGDTEKNSIMGFFADYQAADWYLYGQLLVDDFNANFLFNPDGDQYPSKVAVSLGATLEVDEWGLLGAYAAGATKYTFAPMGYEGSNFQYSYTLYPASAYFYDDSWYGINVEDNMLGYRNGENDLSCCLVWETRTSATWGFFSAMASYMELEASVTGAQSPGNPWHEYEFWKQFPDCAPGRANTAFLDDERLRYRLRLRGRASLKLIDNLSVSLGYLIGYEWNRMVLDTDAGHVDPADLVNGQPVWRPGTEQGFFGALELFLGYAVAF